MLELLFFLLYLYSVHQGTAAPKRAVKTSVSTSTSAGGLDSLPREDISSKISPNILKGFESADWKVPNNSLVELYFLALELNVSVSNFCRCVWSQLKLSIKFWKSLTNVSNQLGLV